MRPFRGEVERSELRSVYMVVYTRPRGVASFAHMGSLQESWRPPAAAGAVAAGCGGAVAASRAAAPSVSAGGGGLAAPAPASRGAFAPWVRDELSSWGDVAWRDALQAFIAARNARAAAEAELIVTGGDA